MTPVADLARSLKNLRQQRGMTQVDLAIKAGLSPGYVARLETARQDPTLTTIEKLASALGVTPSTLLKHAKRGAEGIPKKKTTR